MDDKFKKETNIIAQNVEVLKSDKVDSRFNYTTYPLFSDEAIYVIDHKDNSICYQRNIEALLGYSESEFDFDLAYSIIHPEDLPMVEKVVVEILEHGKNEGIQAGSVFRITFRVQKKDGSYVKILRSSGVCRMNPNKTMRRNFSIIQDISYLDTSNGVKWYLENPQVDSPEFVSSVKVMPTDIFTKREYEVYAMLREGMESKSIAEKLGLSLHTIVGYRKNMLKKTKARNTLEMLQLLESGSLFKP